MNWACRRRRSENVGRALPAIFLVPKLHLGTRNMLMAGCAALSRPTRSLGTRSFSQGASYAPINQRKRRAVPDLHTTSCQAQLRNQKNGAQCAPYRVKGLRGHMNNWGIPDWLVKEVRERDQTCVYCGIQMIEKMPAHGLRKAMATWEHIINDASIVSRENIARCCVACNSS
jgi:hypothetical protein